MIQSCRFSKSAVTSPSSCAMSLHFFSTAHKRSLSSRFSFSSEIDSSIFRESASSIPISLNHHQNESRHGNKVIPFDSGSVFPDLVRGHVSGGEIGVRTFVVHFDQEVASNFTEFHRGKSKTCFIYLPSVNLGGYKTSMIGAQGLHSNFPIFT
jgi:hypothetical protein